MKVESVPIGSIRPHPRNYRAHPADQIRHIIQSIRDHGFYRNIVVANDGTILAGHGVVQAAKEMGLAMVPVIKLSVGKDDPGALKILAGDNEISNLGAKDDRALFDILRTIAEQDVGGLLGTGFDEATLANLSILVQPDGSGAVDPETEWAGMPEFDQSDKTAMRSLIVHFATQADIDAFAKLVKQPISPATRSLWYPEAERMKTSIKAYAG